MVLDDARVARFHEQGFLLLPDLLDVREVAILKAELAGLCEMQGPEIVRERTGTPRMVFRTHDPASATVTPGFHALARLPRVLGPAQQVLGSDALYVHHSKTNVKEAIDGTAYRWHQDYGYWKYDGIPEGNMATMMVMLDEATELGGCLYFLPGSHRRGRVEPVWDDQTSSYGTWVVPRETMLEAMANCPAPVAVTGLPGTAAIFHCNLIHGSGHNLSRNARWHTYVAFNTCENHAREVDSPRPEWVRGTDFTPLEVVADDAIGAGVRR